ncbi:MAG: hypothetical protein SGJ19_22685 [Planctomycetia bacterium]|nr:hypothetical protein [Planctomycetia bacterium]
MEEIQQWRTALQGPDVAERAAAAESLCHAGQDAAPAILELVHACEDDEAVSEWAVAALEELGPPPAELLEPLTKLASVSKAPVAYWAVTLLGRLGPAAIGSEHVLAALLQDSRETAVQERAAWALGEIGAKTAATLTALNGAAQPQSPRLARMAKTALEQIQK